ncbi:hypothetical protein NCC49_005756 [Naganishia albida]|nr:hypothetical protein NCC49_005756 [Naganishia albida]
MRTNPLLLGTMASVLAIGNASPIPQGDAIIIVDDVAPNVGRPIRWLRESDGAELCLQVDSITGPPEAQLRNGGSVTLGNCFPEDNPNFPFQQWVYNSGSTKICVAPNEFTDTQYCIDFGTNLGADGQTLYIWQAYDVPQQQLYITDDNHIAVENGPGFCVDVRAESGPQPDYARPYGSQKSVQTWTCAGGNTNQASFRDLASFSSSDLTHRFSSSKRLPPMSEGRSLGGQRTEPTFACKSILSRALSKSSSVTVVA